MVAQTASGNEFTGDFQHAGTLIRAVEAKENKFGGTFRQLPASDEAIRIDPERTSYANEIVAVSLLAAAMGGAISDRTFSNCVILGPALILPVDLDFAVFAGTDPPPSVFYYLPADRVNQGIPGLVPMLRCSFDASCEFRYIGIGLRPAMLDRVREVFAFPPGAIFGEPTEDD
jgi:hypothetical protein